MNFLRGNILTKKRSLCQHGLIIQIHTLEKLGAQEDQNLLGMETGSAKAESLISDGVLSLGNH